MTKTTVRMDRAALSRVEDDLARRGFARLGERLMGLAEDRTPVDSGKLRHGMWAGVWHDGRNVWSRGPIPSAPALRGTGIEVLVGNDTSYARYVHDGTVDTEAHPFLAEALAIARPTMGQTVAR